MSKLFINQLLQSNLTSVHNCNENNFLINDLTGDASFWIGGRAENNADWKWEDNSEWDYSNWAYEQNSNLTVKCVMLEQGFWKGHPCDKEHGFVCQRIPGVSLNPLGPTNATAVEQFLGKTSKVKMWKFCDILQNTFQKRLG